MVIRSKTIRRLSILAAASGVVLLLGLGLYVRNVIVRGNQLAADRVAGMKAFGESNFSDAAWKLHQVVERDANDFEAAYAYAASRAELGSGDGSHLVEARKLLRNLVLQQPTNLQARHKLMEVYEKSGLASDLFELANDTLKTNPKDVESLKYRVAVLQHQGKLIEALQASRAVNDVVPLDVQAHVDTLNLMLRNRFPASDILARAQEIVLAHPDDKRLLLVLSWAKRDTGDVVGSDQLLEQLLAEAPPADPDYLRMLVRTLDYSGRFDRSQQVLERASLATSDVKLLEPLIERLWQGGRFADVAERLSGETSKPRADVELVAYHTMALFSLGQETPARELLKGLENRTGEQAAQVWAKAIKIRFASPEMSLADSTRELRDVVSRDPANGVFSAWLASNLSQGGELTAALEMWENSVRLIPSWAVPHLEMSQAMLQAGRVEPAWQAARQAYQRQPEPRVTFVQLAVTTHLMLRERPDAKIATELLDTLERYQVRFPNDTATLPIYVASLARAGNGDRAREVADAFLQSPNSSRAAALEQLLAVSQEYALGLTQAISKRAIDTRQLSPALGLAQAREIESVEGFDKALQSFASFPRDSGTPGDWGLAQARFEEAVRPSAAALTWRSLAKANPAQLGIQLAVLEEALSVRGDRAFVLETIDRVKAIVGESSGRWQIEKARWLLEGGTDDQAREAAALLSVLVQNNTADAQTRVMLARALVRVNSTPTAIEHLRAAIEQNPSAPAPAIELCKLLIAAGKRDEMEKVLARLASFDPSDKADRIAVCLALIEAGMPDPAVTLLERAVAKNTIDPDGLLLLAELKASANQTTQAASLYTQLLMQPSPGQAAKVSAATFLRRSGDDARAMQLIDEVIADSAKEPSVKSLAMLAQYHGLFGEVEAARQSYQSAIQLAPQNVEVVRQAVMYELSQGDAQSAMTLVDRSRQTVTDKGQLEQLATQVRLANASAPASLRELAKSMAKDPQRSAQAKAIDALASAIESGAPGDDPDLARALADLARQYPAAIALQQRAITQLIQANMPLDAADLARRLAQAMPTHAVALRLAARTALQCGRPGEAQDYAQRWRASTGDPVEQMDADFVLASILMGNDRVQEAMNRIRPHLANVKGEQEFNVMVAAQVIRRAGSASDAARFLEPMLATSTPARSAWMSISSSLSDVVARRAMLTQFARVVASTASVDTLSLAGEWTSVFERSSDPADLKKAVELAEQCLAVPELKRSATLVLAEALRRSGDDKRSVALLEELVKSDANDAAAANALAFTLLSIGQADDRAEALARTSATLAPQAAVPLDTLARVLVARGKPDEAAATFEQALKLDRNYLDAMVGLASLRQSQQRADQVQLLMSRVDQRLTELGSSPAFVVPSHLRSELAKLREGVSTVPAQ